MISIGEDELCRILEENRRLKDKVDEMQAHSTDQLMRNRGNDRRKQVSAFHAKFNQPIASSPYVPGEAIVRMRLRLIAEEFFELLDAAVSVKDEQSLALTAQSHAYVQSVITCSLLAVDLPEFADALADLDYVIEGTRLAFGIDGSPIAIEVHRTNMLKEGGGTRADGKIAKPPGWTPPDIAGELRLQGWDPNGKMGTEVSP